MVNKRAKLTPQQSVGKCLRERREQLRLSLTGVANELRIPPKQLAALEEGSLSAFPAEVYARGAYQKYAQFLGVEGWEQYHSFLRCLSEVRREVPLRLPVPATWLQRALTPYGIIALGAVLAVMAVLIYLGWELKGFIQLPKLELAAPIAAVTDKSELTIEGWTEEETAVTINGETIRLNDDNRFSFAWPLKPGSNFLRVEAKGVSGRVKVLEHELWRQS